ncbi:MAG: type II toxin-antitoxin system YafQ family toxin [Clostridia bacterium]|nr:type II toxin-antitoxin system YafQ family toxin [Clostridia bacterium]
MKYDIVITNKCKKDIQKVSKQGKNLDLLFEVVDMLSEGQQLDPKYKDHKLTGEYEGKRECHIEPDLLLIYQIEEKEIVLYLVRVGSHSDLF